MDYEDYDDEADVEGEEALKEEVQAAVDEHKKAVGKLLDTFSAQGKNDMLNKALAIMVDKLSDCILGDVRSSIRTLVQAECGKKIQALASEHMPKVFGAVLEERVFAPAKKEYSWETTQKSIKEIIEDEMKAAVKKLDSRDTRESLIKEAVKDFMSKEVLAAVKQATEQFKTETVNELKKGMMQEVIKAVATAIGNDKRMLALLQTN